MLNLNPSLPINNHSTTSNFTVQQKIFLYKNFSCSKIKEEVYLSHLYISIFENLPSKSTMKA